MIVTEPPSRPEGEFPSLPKAALSRFLTRAQKAVGLEGEVTVLLADDARLKELNRGFRGKNKATDVLSFPAFENADGIAGDLAISVETAQRQAAEHGHALDAELRILMLHGILHLAGHDHEADKGEMRALEAELQTKLKLPSGLIERTLAPAKNRVPRPYAKRGGGPRAKRDRSTPAMAPETKRAKR